MHALYLLSVWLHLLSIAVWLGGMILLVLVIVPVLRQQEYQHLRFLLLNWMGTRFRAIGWMCLGLLALTGGVNLVYRGVSWPELMSLEFWQGSFGKALGIKLLLVSVIFLLSAIHDFSIGPRATMAGQTNPGSEEALSLRKQASWIGRINLLLALVVIALGIMLVRGSP